MCCLFTVVSMRLLIFISKTSPKMVELIYHAVVYYPLYYTSMLEMNTSPKMVELIYLAVVDYPLYYTSMPEMNTSPKMVELIYHTVVYYPLYYTSMLTPPLCKPPHPSTPTLSRLRSFRFIPSKNHNDERPVCLL